MNKQSEHPVSSHSLFRDMLTGSGLYMIANLGPRLASFILVPIVTRRLTTADYGVLDLLEQIGVVLSVIVGINFSEVLGFFYSAPEQDRHAVVGTVFGGSLMLGSSAGLIGWIFADPIGRYMFHTSAYVPLLRLTFAAMPAAFFAEAAMGWLRVENRAPLFTGLALIRTALGAIGTIVLLVGFDRRVGGVISANVSAGILIALILGGVALRVQGLHFHFSLFRRMLRYSSFLTISAIASFAIHFGDRFVLPHYRPFADLGVYAVAYKIGMLISMVQSSFGTYWAAQIYQILKRPDAAWVFARSFTYYIAGLLACGLTLLVASKPALAIFAPPTYSRAAGLIPIILMAYLIRSVGDFFRFVFLAYGVPHFEATCNWMTAAVSFALYFLLIPRYGIYGAAGATLIAFVFAAVVSLVWVRRVWEYRVEGKRLAKLLLAAGVVVALYFAFPFVAKPAQIAFGALLLALFAALLLMLRFPTTGEIGILRTSLRRFIAPPS